ncbi:MAG: hypothetical protein ABI972_29690 [Acidobacteriota bacterium]
MHIREMDFRQSWTTEVMHALDGGIERCTSGTPDGLDGLEHAEEIVGLAFVALQTYVAATEADLQVVFPTLTAHKAFRQRHSAEISGVTYVEAICAAANFYKHREEPGGCRASTINPLTMLGITQSTEFPCVGVHKLMSAGSYKLAHLAQVVFSWRQQWLSQLREEALKQGQGKPISSCSSEESVAN